MGRIIKSDTADKITQKKFAAILQLIARGLAITCPKCGELAERIPLRKLGNAFRDLLVENHVFKCFAYCCEFCEEADVEILTYV